MIMKDKYWIDSVQPQESGNDIMKGTISCSNHGACIDIFGSRHDLTERLVVIIQALNQENDDD